MLILLRTSINPVTCRSSLLFYPGIFAHGGDYLSGEVHANRDLAVKGNVVASPAQCLVSIPVCIAKRWRIDSNYASISMRFYVIFTLRNRSPEFSAYYPLVVGRTTVRWHTWTGYDFTNMQTNVVVFSDNSGCERLFNSINRELYILCFVKVEGTMDTYKILELAVGLLF
ncbi:hypothetical protein CDAR_195741 [Caerostris darwini]|uniref:Uncharacterized protein n=1 Tax=Caerostris darwini TaxID=1538125 RepID=A0AAV4S3I1_9ARAC|nr:hypothetical protein CDAR_195741 [Caerostris darwini]